MTVRRQNLEEQQALGTEGIADMLHASRPGRRPRKTSVEKNDELIKVRKERTKTNRSGSKLAPYERRDHVKTVKVSFVGRAEFAKRLAVYTSSLLGRWQRADWIEAALTKAMDDSFGRENSQDGDEE